MDTISAYVTWSNIPLLVSLAPLAFYGIGFSFFESDHLPGLLPIAIQISLYLFLACISLWTLSSEQEVDKSFRKSSSLIFAISLLRIVHAVLEYVLAGYPAYSSMALQSAFLLIFWILYFTSGEYFGSYLGSRDPRNAAASSEEKRVSTADESQSLINARGSVNSFPLQNSLDPTRDEPHIGQGVQPETVFLGIFSTVTLTIVLYNLVPQNTSVEKLFYSIFIWMQMLSCGAWLLLKLLQVRALSNRGIFFSQGHSDGFAWFLLLLGAAMRLVIDFVAIMRNPDSLASPWVASSFVSLGTEAFTQILPFTFHLFNVRQRRNYAKLASKDHMCDASGRIKLFYYISVATLHMLMVGYTMELGTGKPRLIVAARSAGLVATVDLSCLALAFLAPLGTFISKHFSFGIMHSSDKPHLHRSMAWSALFFSLLHVALHLAFYLSQGSSASVPSNLYAINNTPVITGIIMAACFLGALVTGALIPRKKYLQFVYSMHIPLSCAGFLAFFVHGYDKITGSPVGSELCEGVFIASAAISILFFILFRIRYLDVDRVKTVYGTHYILLSLKYNGSNFVPPGAFFNIYGSSSSHLSIFHSHSFPVFSTRNSRIIFLIRSREAPKGENRASFTERLKNERPFALRVQGPFKGPANAFVLNLNSVSLARQNKCILLCGWGSGFASIFSLLEYFKNNKHRIHSITGVLSVIPDEVIQRAIHASIDTLVREWPTDHVSLRVVELQTMDQFYTFAANYEGVHPREGLKSWNAGGGIDGAAGRIEQKMLYFCGNNLQYDRLGKWDHINAEAN